MTRRQVLAAAGTLLAAGNVCAQPEVTPRALATGHCNFVELGLDKSDPARHAHRLRLRPWTLTVDGLVHRPLVLDVDALGTLFDVEERIYRFRCVEAWAMVVPWLGIPLARILERAQPLADARHVAFQTLLDPKQLPNQKSGFLPWPYVEGLRMEEAMHPLTLLAVGMYGGPLPAQNGGPARLVVPWKYGFKSIKSVVRMTVVPAQPPTSWSRQTPSEYGYLANVNPMVPHPRWTQSRERLLGTNTVQRTQLFNGYGEDVAGLYANVNLRQQY